MKKHVVSDFISADINIVKVERIYRHKTHSWYRPVKQAREYDGLLYFVSGDIRYEFGSTVFEAHAGQVLRLARGVPYDGVKISSDVLEYYCIDFLSDDYADFEHLALPYAFTPTDGERVKEIFSMLEEKWQKSAPGRLLEIKMDMFKLLVYLIRDYANNECRYGEQSRILNICEHIEQNLKNRDYSISDTARAFHITPTHLRRLFAHELGISPLQYLLNLRIELAKQMLVSRSDLSVMEIGEACGYSSLYYFSNAFKKMTGLSPKEYVNKTKREI